MVLETPEKTGSPPLSIRAYARRLGTSEPSVLRAIKRGRLKNSLVYVDGVAQIGDPDLADEEWAANTDLTKAPAYVKARAAARVPKKPPGVPANGEATTGLAPSMAEAAFQEKRWKARLAEQEFLKQAGELVNAKDALHAFTAQVVEARTKLLAVPSKVKGRIPELTLAHIAIIDEEIRLALEEVGRSKAR